MAHPYADRLIYAADMSFEKGHTLEQMVGEANAALDSVCEAFHGLGITIKGNSTFRLVGADAFSRLDQARCNVFGDYKLFDVQSTCINDGSWLQNVSNLRVLTVNSDVHPAVFAKLSEMLPSVIIAPIRVLTDLVDEDFARRGEVDRETAVRKFFADVMHVISNGAICSPKDLSLAPEGFRDNRTIITPGIRPLYTFVEGDTNAANALTPTKAIRAGANRLVVGSPIRHQGRLRENAERILDEIGEAVET